ncbi:MAG: phosphoglycerate mutase family protein [Nitrosotalea sp.]
MLEHNEFYLYLIRHGQSEINAMPDMVGQKEDSRLTGKGRNQAKLLGQRFAKEGKKLDSVYTSPYVRANDTCQIAMAEIPDDLKAPIFQASPLRE